MLFPETIIDGPLVIEADTIVADYRTSVNPLAYSDEHAQSVEDLVMESHIRRALEEFDNANTGA